MRKSIVVLLLLVVLVGSVFADFRFSGGANVVWGFDFNKKEFTASGRDNTPSGSAAAANMVIKVTGDYFYFVFGGAVSSRSATTEGMNARITLKGKTLFKEAGIEIENLDQLDFLVGNQVIRSNVVYADPLAHDDGSVKLLIATNAKCLPMGVEFGTQDWTARIGGTIVKDHGEFGANFRIKLLEGALWAEAGYAYNKETEAEYHKSRMGHSFDDGGNGHRVGASATIDLMKLFGKEDLSVILSGDAQLNFNLKEANAYYAAACIKTDSFFLAGEYRDIPKTITNENTESRNKARVRAVEGKVSYKILEDKLTPEIAVTAGKTLSRKTLPDQAVAYDDDGYMGSISGSITILGLTLKLGYTYNKFEPDKYYGTSRAYFELNFKF